MECPHRDQEERYRLNKKRLWNKNHSNANMVVTIGGNVVVAED